MWKKWCDLHILIMDIFNNHVVSIRDGYVLTTLFYFLNSFYVRIKKLFQIGTFIKSTIHQVALFSLFVFFSFKPFYTFNIVFVIDPTLCNNVILIFSLQFILKPSFYWEMHKVSSFVRNINTVILVYCNMSSLCVSSFKVKILLTICRV